MGCSESRCWLRSCSDKPEQQAVIDKQGGDETEAFLEDVREAKSFISEETPADGCWLDLPSVSKPVILDFAQKMSEDIVAQALQLCWEVEIHYKELPFIDSDHDYII